MIKKQTTKKIQNKLVLGNVISLKITALGANNVGINEFSYGIPVLVPNAKLGDIVRAKIVKILTSQNNKQASKKIALAKLIKVVTAATNKQADNKNKTLISGVTLDVTINKLGPNNTGIVDLSNTYNNVTKLIIKNSNGTVFSADGTSQYNVTVTRIKKDYAFAVVNNVNKIDNFTGVQTKSVSDLSSAVGRSTGPQVGSKFSVVLPYKAKRYLKHFVFKVLDNSFLDLTQTILFVKPRLGAKLGDKVQIKITSIHNFNESTIVVAKIIKLNPLSASYKKELVRSTLRQMLKSGMHYGEKAIKCNARMKNYVWTSKKGSPIKFSLTKTIDGSANFNTNGRSTVHSFFKNGTGTQINNLASSMPQAFGKKSPLIKKGRNIINLLKTRRCLNKALAQLTKYAAKGKTFLFVGTKKAASGLVARAALFSKKAFFVNTRWLGGMLTNWKTILKSISKIRPILKEKQMIIKDILEKRQTIKARLIQKALLLRKKSKLMIKKGRQLLQKQANTKFFETANLLNTFRKDIFAKNIKLLEKRQQLFVKRQELITQSQTLKAKAIKLTNVYQRILNNLMLSRKKLRELKSLLIISNSLQTVKQQAKQNNQNLYMVSYNKYKTLNPLTRISNPPKEILNKMVKIIKSVKNPSLNLKSSTTSNKTLILSELLSKFSLFVPYILSSIKNIQTYISAQKTSLNKVKELFLTIKNKMTVYITLKNKLVGELQKIKQTLQTERNIIRVLRRKFKQIFAQKRLIKFLPKLRYLPTPLGNFLQTTRFLMKKFVDPKIRFPMDSIYDEKLSRQSKKVAASRKKKWQRLEKYLGGISNMTKINEKQIRNNVAIIIGQQEEMNAVRECQKLGIKMFHIVDTNCNPGFADHFIPANDDARNSIKYILGKFLTRIRLAQKLKMKFKKVKTKKTFLKAKKKTERG